MHEDVEEIDAWNLSAGWIFFLYHDSHHNRTWT